MAPDSRSEKLVVYVVTQYASQANRRVVKVLQLQKHFDRMTFVSERGAKLHHDALVVRKPHNPTAVLKLLGLQGIRRAVDQKLYFPSPAVIYVRAAVNALRVRIKCDLQEGRKVCVMTMTPPHELAMVGLQIKSEFPQVRWVLDWQDLWSYDEYYFDNIANEKKPRVKELEQQVLQTCDVNVVTNPRAKQVLENAYGVAASKVVSIGHPFDYDELGEVSLNGNGRRPSEPIRVGFLGHLFKLPKVPGNRVVEAFEYVRRNGINVELHVYGDMQSVTADAARDRDWMFVHPRLPHNESLREVAKCNFLLLTLADLPNTRIIMHAKLAHYLILKRPIIAMVPDECFVADLIRRTNTGSVIPTSEEWGSGLERTLHDSPLLSLLPRNESEISQYSWDTIAIKWVEAIAGYHSNN